MSLTGETYLYDSDLERRYDDLVESKGFTPDEARRRLGIIAVSQVTDDETGLRTPADHRAATPRAASGPQYGDSAESETPEGVPHYYQTELPVLTPQDIQRRHHFTRHWREEAEKAIRENRGKISEE